METLQQFIQDTDQYRTIPLTYSFLSDTLTAVQLFQTLRDQATYILESHDPSSPWSRYSFIGLNPFIKIKEEQRTFQIYDYTNDSVAEAPSFKDALNDVLNNLTVKIPEVNFPFKGGGVGYISYDAISDFEKVPDPNNQDIRVARYQFLFCETIIAFDHEKKEVALLHFVRLNGDETDDEKTSLYNGAVTKIDSLLEQIKQSTTLSDLMMPIEQNTEVDLDGIESNYSKEKFKEHVNKIKEYILDGDIFQGVLSQRFHKKVNVSGFELYRVLRKVNPSPYLFYFQMDGFEIIGSSPERLIQIENGHLEIHPIAGTRRRGRTKEEDKALEQELLADEKEIAEHYMLVDLARNDIGRVANFGSVDTPVLKTVTHFSHVMHIISKVTGRLRDDVQPLDALVSSFPAGTVSGAPKIRAMQILQELEPTARNLYAGAIVYIGYDGNIDSCITIRTIFLQDETAYVQAGAGIVADSKPELEWKETVNKASALLRTIQSAEKLFAKAPQQGGMTK
ncbi:anthranilate synthase component I [Bacillus sp. SM2101]|uniref:anthranilate synthase component I n=1 Tax=Bacillus sp. SM2101 TaxID=2805366 RepID=UPI001BDEA439|nr:anthranilate synthase component I [Bacillus sp. SM2101]